MLLHMMKARLVPRPMRTPTSRSVKTIASTVTAKGMNCALPSAHIERTSFGLASLKPVTTSTAASAESGMRLRSPGSSATLPSSSRPWKIAERLVREPAFTFTELRMITEVIGRPPTMPAAMLPTPWARSSRFCGVQRRWGSRRSVASMLRSVSSDATIASVTAAR